MIPTYHPIVIAHRGAQDIFPEHTMPAYKAAIAQGADYIEQDLVVSKDGVLVVRHDAYLSTTTNVADFEIFKDKKNTKTVDGIQLCDWFVSDFTLEE